MLELLLGLVALVFPLTLVAVFMHGGLAFFLIARAAVIRVVTGARPTHVWPEGGLAVLLRSPLKAVMNLEGLTAGRDARAGGTELFERPDAGSRVLCTLPADAVVTYRRTEGDFLCVETADHLVGYLPASACVPEPSPSRP
jgi:hypothetical protein